MKQTFDGDHLKLEAPDMPDLRIPLRPKNGDAVRLKQDFDVQYKSTVVVSIFLRWYCLKSLSPFCFPVEMTCEDSSFIST